MRRASAWNELAKGAFRRVVWWCATHLRHFARISSGDAPERKMLS